MDIEAKVRQALAAAEDIVSLAEGVLHGGKELGEDQVEELLRRARDFGGPRTVGQLRDAQRSLSSAAQSLSDAARFERDRKRSRSPDGQKRNWLARNMALSAAKLNAAMAEMHLTALNTPEAQQQLHELTQAVEDLSEGVHETSEQVAHGGVAGRADAEAEERQPPSSAGSGGMPGAAGGHHRQPRGKPGAGRAGAPRRRRHPHTGPFRGGPRKS